MEEPIPFTPDQKESYSKYIFSKKINILINNQNYILKIGKDIEGKNISIFLESSDSFSTKIYKSDFSLLSLYKISKYFKIFESLEEIIDFLNQCFDSNKNNIDFNFENNKVIINIEINNLINGKNLIKLELLEEVKVISKNDLLQEIQKMNKKMQEFSAKINSIESENKLLKEKINQVEKENKLLKEKIKIMEKEKINDNIIQFSKIIENGSSLKFIFQHLRKHFYISQDKKIESKLIYRASSDGPTPSIYHEKCNGIPKTLCFIKTTEDIIFGGYANIKLVGGLYGENRNDKDAFAFSLNLSKIYLPKNEPSLHFNEYYGPIFGNNNHLRYIFFVESDNFFEKGGWTCTVKNNAYDGFLVDYEINGGKKNFQIKEMEVYQLSF